MRTNDCERVVRKAKERIRHLQRCCSVRSSLGRGLNFRALVLAFSEARRQGFSRGTPVSFPSSLINGSANRIKLK